MWMAAWRVYDYALGAMVRDHIQDIPDTPVLPSKEYLFREREGRVCGLE